MQSCGRRWVPCFRGAVPGERRVPDPRKHVVPERDHAFAAVNGGVSPLPEPRKHDTRAEGESFLTEITTKGKVLYEKDHAGMGAQSRKQLPVRRANSRGSEPFHDQACFYCQESAEKYLKALLEEQGLAVSRVRSLNDLLGLLSPHHPSLQGLRRGLIFLTDFTIKIVYPGDSATKRQAAAALRWAGRVRAECRMLLGLDSSSARRHRGP